MTDSHPDGNPNRPPMIDRHLPPAEPKREGPMGSIEGADSAALGLEPEPLSAPSGAHVDPTMRQVPGAKFGEDAPTTAKPWATSLATENDDAGIGAKPDPAGEV
jgi:hypothetical protein